MICSHCGSPMDDGSSFCAACGAPLGTGPGSGGRHFKPGVVLEDDEPPLGEAAEDAAEEAAAFAVEGAAGEAAAAGDAGEVVVSGESSEPALDPAAGKPAPSTEADCEADGNDERDVADGASREDAADESSSDGEAEADGAQGDDADGDEAAGADAAIFADEPSSGDEGGLATDGDEPATDADATLLMDEAEALELSGDGEAAEALVEEARDEAADGEEALLDEEELVDEATGLAADAQDGADAHAGALEDVHVQAPLPAPRHSQGPNARPHHPDAYVGPAANGSGPRRSRTKWPVVLGVLALLVAGAAVCWHLWDKSAALPAANDAAAPAGEQAEEPQDAQVTGAQTVFYGSEDSASLGPATRLAFYNTFGEPMASYRVLVKKSDADAAKSYDVEGSMGFPASALLGDESGLYTLEAVDPGAHITYLPVTVDYDAAGGAKGELVVKADPEGGPVTKASDDEAAATVSASKEDDPADKDGDYVLPSSDTKIYSADELSKLSNYELFLARNEIFARHGRTFNSRTLNGHFGSKSWYDPKYSADEFDALDLLNTAEKQNVENIRALEASRGSNYMR